MGNSKKGESPRKTGLGITFGGQTTGSHKLGFTPLVGVDGSDEPSTEREPNDRKADSRDEASGSE